MKITVGELFEMKQPLERLIQCKVPVRTGFAIKKLAEAVSAELVVAGKQHDELIMEYGEEVPADSQKYAVLPTSPKLVEFDQKMDELKAIEVDINIVPILLPETVETETGVLMSLQKFIKV